MRSVVRPLAAEFIGTFGLVFVGGGAVVLDAATGGGVGLLGIALAHALVLSVMVTALMNVSGAHFNPAVTLAIWMSNRIDARRAGLFVLTQVAAAVFAAFCIKWLYPAGAGVVAGYGVPRISEDLTLLNAILLEAVFTFFLVSAVFGTVVSVEAPKVGGFGIGLVLIFAILAVGPLTGAALNPARAFGPALVANDWLGHVAYWIGPALGAAVAGVLWSKILLPLEKQ